MTELSYFDIVNNVNIVSNYGWSILFTVVTARPNTRHGKKYLAVPVPVPSPSTYHRTILCNPKELVLSLFHNSRGLIPERFSVRGFVPGSYTQIS